MADDELPDNIDLRFLAKQNARILRELGEMREQTQNIPQMRADISEIQIAVAAISTDLKAVKADVAGIAAVQKNQGERLNAIDGRLGLLEKHIGIIDI
jgi:DNA repair ATPase RecN